MLEEVEKNRGKLNFLLSAQFEFRIQAWPGIKINQRTKGHGDDHWKNGHKKLAETAIHKPGLVEQVHIEASHWDKENQKGQKPIGLLIVFGEKEQATDDESLQRAKQNDRIEKNWIKKHVSGSNQSVNPDFKISNYFIWTQDNSQGPDQKI